MPSAPLGVSSQSRKKLKAFAFDVKLLAGEDDKENQTVNSAPSPVEQPQDACNNQDEVQEPKIPHTPAVRIPIEDLIANTEDAYNCAPPLATPIDHVLWQSHPDGSDASGAAGGTQRSRKRAHSSSPASSQQFSVQNDAMNLHTLNRSLRSPNNDPTQDLWNRYTTGNGLKQDVKEPILPAYAHLLPSSPQTPSTTSKDSGLRRTASCGVEWPTSKLKRRRLDEQHSRTKELFAASRKEILRRDVSNNTRVGLLLEKIQEGLTKKADLPESPSSSSPLPDRRSQVFVSPTKPPNRVRQGSNGPRGASHSPQKGSPLKNDASHATSFSSEFGEDAFDAEELECCEQILAQTQAQNNATTTVFKNVESILEDKPASQPRPSVRFLENEAAGDLSQQFCAEQAPSPAVPKSAAVIKLDEFDGFDGDDDDDEDLMSEMLSLAARYDSQGQVIATDQPHSQANIQSKHLETLDEFDDAFDDDDDKLWEDIADATQKGRTPVGSRNHVCLT